MSGENKTYTKVAITLHWVIALMIIGQLGTGIIMGYKLVDKSMLFPLYQFHKSLGLSVLALSVLRLLWRLTHKAPPLPGHMPLWEKLAAKASHYFFYFFMLAIPFSGWLIVSSSSFGLPTMWFNFFEWPHIPGIANLADAQKEQVNHLSETLHIYMAYALLALLCLHIAAALKHHFIDKDEVLHHMIPAIKPKLPRLPLALVLCTLISFPAQAANWLVDPAKSSIEFSGENSGTKFTGKFETWDSVIDFDATKLETSSVKVTVKTASAKTGNPMFDGTLPKKEWFDAEAHPDAVFESKEIKSLGGDKYEAKGKLTIKDISQDLTLPFTLTIKDKNASMKSELNLDRLVFDIGKKSDPKAEWVSKDIPLIITVEATQK